MKMEKWLAEQIDELPLKERLKIKDKGLRNIIIWLIIYVIIIIIFANL